MCSPPPLLISGSISHHSMLPRSLAGVPVLNPRISKTEQRIPNFLHGPFHGCLLRWAHTQEPKTKQQESSSPGNLFNLAQGKNFRTRDASTKRWSLLAFTRQITATNPHAVIYSSSCGFQNSERPSQVADSKKNNPTIHHASGSTQHHGHRALHLKAESAGTTAAF